MDDRQCRGPRGPPCRCLGLAPTPALRPGGAIRTLTPFFFLLWHPLSDVWWLPTNRHRLPTNRHRLHTNRHRLPTNHHRLHTYRHRLRIGHSEFFFFSLRHPLPATCRATSVRSSIRCHGPSAGALRGPFLSWSVLSLSSLAVLSCQVALSRLCSDPPPFPHSWHPPLPS